MKAKAVAKFTGISVLVLASAALVWGYTNYQYVYDIVRARHYQPTTQITTIAEKLQLTDTGTFLFQASQPELNPASKFNRDCSQNSETNNPILGCYVNDTIYVFDVTNKKLNGIEETTTAHELLHAVYQRLSSDERRAINTELQSAYQKNKTAELSERMEYYRKSEPGEEMNELHSILGTEVASLSPKLEAHYRQYFRSRQHVVTYYRAYSDVFAAAKTTLETLSQKINRDTKSINQDKQQLNQDIANYDRDRQALVNRSNQGQGVSQADVNQINARADALNARASAINAAIAASNADRRRFNQLAKAYNDLNESINSSLAPAPIKSSAAS